MSIAESKNQKKIMKAKIYLIYKWYNQSNNSCLFMKQNSKWIVTEKLAYKKSLNAVQHGSWGW